jgi:hypothetical protein
VVLRDCWRVASEYSGMKSRFDRRLRGNTASATAALALLAITALGCKAVAPSNDRDWSEDQAILPEAEVIGGQAHITNVRYCDYLSEDIYLTNYYDKTYDLDRVRSVDFIIVPFQGTPSLAHTMLSFGFEGGDYLCLSVEIRKEKGESYAAWKGSMRQYELMYVLGDERDLVKLRSNYRGDDVYIYRTVATPAQSRALLVDVLARVDKLHDSPEFYDSIANNCTNNIARHVNDISPSRVPYDLRVLLPGFSDRLAYNLGLLVDHGGFEATKGEAWVSGRARRYAESPNFSEVIRR